MFGGFERSSDTDRMGGTTSAALGTVTGAVGRSMADFRLPCLCVWWIFMDRWLLNNFEQIGHFERSSDTDRAGAALCTVTEARSRLIAGFCLTCFSVWWVLMDLSLLNTFEQIGHFEGSVDMADVSFAGADLFALTTFLTVSPVATSRVAWIHHMHKKQRQNHKQDSRGCCMMWFLCASILKNSTYFIRSNMTTYTMKNDVPCIAPFLHQVATNGTWYRVSRVSLVVMYSGRPLRVKCTMAHVASIFLSDDFFGRWFGPCLVVRIRFCILLYFS